MKKKTLHGLLGMMIIFSTQAWSQTQMNYWALPPYKVNLTGASPTASLLPVLNGPSAIYVDSHGFTYFTDQSN